MTLRSYMPLSWPTVRTTRLLFVATPVREGTDDSICGELDTSSMDVSSRSESATRWRVEAVRGTSDMYCGVSAVSPCSIDGTAVRSSRSASVLPCETKGTTIRSSRNTKVPSSWPAARTTTSSLIDPSCGSVMTGRDKAGTQHRASAVSSCEVDGTTARLSRNVYLPFP
ncbi:uncharacterized protein B0H18DRAFT_1043517 [Fomitopsis serialis]|uniref:uncharacterized protein n=1 Tax=Fomitopsis serialis TaxID=139415 RepID=UPI002007C7E3|nr:uncharacterized protein B0H18DRAFT_1065967 [Neoantrodia serialis]XP_047886890.1 uncharacterized protein B0H18DRAFT_1043517 [Neoantrodia serialis]KAH9910859.1 hypothetical protein B0H18DRAFT_1065967 [Neoantrodia serialis]KAH9914974.1 hypothetical protein B0H18DRAFT_1043517 [Neoantrodia serialis]